VKEYRGIPQEAPKGGGSGAKLSALAVVAGDEIPGVFFRGAILSLRARFGDAELVGFCSSKEDRDLNQSS